MKFSAEHRAKISKSLTGKKRGPLTTEHREKMSKALKGRKYSVKPHPGVCSRCGGAGPFGRNRNGKGGLHCQCLECSKAQWAAYRAANPEKIRGKNREWELRNPERWALQTRRVRLRKYGITPQDYDRMHVEQRGLCAICLRPERVFKCGKLQSLSVDHSRRTGSVRALLCNSCNNGIGRFEECVERFHSAAAYLLKYQ